MPKKNIFTSFNSFVGLYALKNLILISIIFIKSTHSIAQNKFNLFVKSTFTFCQIDGDNAAGYNKIGYSLGFLSAYNFSENYNFRFGAQYAQIGSRRTLNPDDPSITPFHFIINTVQIPIAISKKIKKHEIGFGAVINYHLSAKDKDATTGLSIDELKKIGLIGFIQYNYQLNKKLFVDITSNYSVTNINAYRSNNTFWRTGTYHNFLSLGILLKL